MVARLMTFRAQKQSAGLTRQPGGDVSAYRQQLLPGLSNGTNQGNHIRFLNSPLRLINLGSRSRVRLTAERQRTRVKVQAGTQALTHS